MKKAKAKVKSETKSEYSLKPKYKAGDIVYFYDCDSQIKDFRVLEVVWDYNEYRYLLLGSDDKTIFRFHERELFASVTDPNLLLALINTLSSNQQKQKQFIDFDQRRIISRIERLEAELRQQSEPKKPFWKRWSRS